MSKTIAILGYGLQGKSAYEYWSALGNEITICDEASIEDLPPGVNTKIGEDYLKNLGVFDLIVRSPSIHPSDISESNSPEILAKVTTNTNEFFKVCPTKNIIGVTGTKGKGTTSTLIAKMLEASGHKVHLGGNIGTPPLEMLNNNIEESDYVVLELANFQLIDLKCSSKIAVCLMVVPEHLDFHPSVEEYYQAKKQLFAHQAEDDTAIYYSKNEDSKTIASAGKGKIIPYYHPPGAIVENDDIVIDGQSICSTSEIKLLGQHNWQNICAAITAVWQIDKNVDAIRSVATTFAGLEYRLQLVRELDGVKYYNDSFGTTPETAIVAIQAFSEPKVVILGGSDKGASFDGLAQVVKNGNVKKAILIGKMAEKIKDALDKTGFDNYELGPDNMQSIVGLARKSSAPGDVVLLSTGCASFGLFKNYKDRGEQFNQFVQELS